MAVHFAPQYKDPNEELKYYMLQMAEMMGQKRREKSEQRKMTKFAESLLPTQTPSAGGQGVFTPGGFGALKEGWLGGQPTETGMIQGAQLTPMQIFQKALQSGIPMQQALGASKLGAQGGGAERGTLPWYLWPEYKSSPAAQRATGEIARSPKPFTPSSTLYMKDYIEKRIDLIKDTCPKRGPGAGKWGGAEYAQSDVLEHYIQEAETIGYRSPSVSAAQRRQFDAIWDTKMKKYKKDLEWNPKSKEVKAIRSALRAGNLPGQAGMTTTQAPAGQTRSLTPATEPQSREEFLETVQSIEDETEAEAYYNKWVSKWQ